MINRTHWIWMPHPAHFILAERCFFRLATVVGKKKKYIVSTVGELSPSESAKNWNKDNPDFKWETLGAGEDDYYETYVFEAEKANHPCCPFDAIIDKQVDGERCGDAKKANKLHIKMCKRWDI